VAAAGGRPQVSVAQGGEHVLGAAGEVHLETCVKDLQERFARIKLQVGARSNCMGGVGAVKLLSRPALVV
jgi:hypothetical protein